MTMPPALRRLALTAHVAASVGWLGAVAVFLVLAITGLTSHQAQTVRAVYVAMQLSTVYVIVPLALAALLTGVIQALGTSWGLVGHYWVLVKLLLTVVATIVLLLQIPSISYLADRAAHATLASTDLRGERMSLVLHSAAGLLVLLVPQALSVYKPRGRTRYGSRRHHELSVGSPAETAPEAGPGRSAR
ncbi:MAG: hypothetical protein M3296_00070 [Actinomycetota bacterium]|nr:hypothetical protein [Actinomycetota bacterium]